MIDFILVFSVIYVAIGIWVYQKVDLDVDHYPVETPSDIGWSILLIIWVFFSTILFWLPVWLRKKIRKY